MPGIFLGEQDLVLHVLSGTTTLFLQGKRGQSLRFHAHNVGFDSIRRNPAASPLRLDRNRTESVGETIKVGDVCRLFSSEGHFSLQVLVAVRVERVWWR